tara:strand:+ start:2695 stop:3054 length:360 start_codon:yes stop_codon:yes gene_type:complete
MSGIPSGNGSEVIKYKALQNVSTTTETLITGEADHIYTIISVVITECDNASDKNFFLGMFDSDGTSNEHIIKMWTPIPPNGTFVWNDKFSFSGDKTFRVKTQTSSNLDVLCTYIEQDWS